MIIYAKAIYVVCAKDGFIIKQMQSSLYLLGVVDLPWVAQSNKRYLLSRL